VAAASETVGVARPGLRGVTLVGSVAAVLLVGATLIRFGISLRGIVWASAQVLLVFVACFDVATRRVPNRVIVPAAAAAFVLRAAFAASFLPEALAAGAIAFAFFLLVAVLARGGMGMGDVKLAGLIGLLLGEASVPALFIGIVAGGVASLAVLVARLGTRSSTIAYAPYLCFGTGLAILAFSPPPLV